MRKIIIYYLLVMIVASSKLSCMDFVLDNPDSNDKKNENRITTSDPDSEDKKKIKASIDQSTSSQKDGNKFNLDLGNLGSPLTKTKSVRQTPTTPRTSVRTQKALVEQIGGVKEAHRQIQVERSCSPRAADSVNPDERLDSPTIFKKKSPVPRTLVGKNSVSNFLEQENHSNEEKMWVFLSDVNPVLYKFAQEHQMDLDSVTIYAKLLNDMRIRPIVLDEFLNKHHKLDVKDSHKTVIQGYKKIKKDNPEYWTTLLLEMFQQLDSQENGATTPSALTNINGTHIGLLHDQIIVEKNDKFKLLILVGIKALILIGGFAWAIYGQVKGTADPCTYAPTNMPTSNHTM